MDNSTHNSDEILVSYLDGELVGDEKAAIEKELSANIDLKNQYDSLLATREAIRYYGLQQRVAGIHQQMMKELQAPVKQISPLRKRIRYSIAIAASLFLFVAGYLAYNFITLSPDKVFSSNYHSYELIVVRDGNATQTPAEKAYQEKNYSEVLRIHDAGEDHSQEGAFLCGMSALETGNTTKAIECFKEVIGANQNSSKKLLNDEAEYYLSLSYIKNKEYSKALDMMHTIQDAPHHLYKERITAKLLRQVKMLKWR